MSVPAFVLPLYVTSRSVISLVEQTILSVTVLLCDVMVTVDVLSFSNVTGFSIDQSFKSIFSPFEVKPVTTKSLLFESRTVPAFFEPLYSADMLVILGLVHRTIMAMRATIHKVNKINNLGFLNGFFLQYWHL